MPLPSFGSPTHGSLRIPELRNIPMDSRLKAVIDHPAFQRLRRIRQLGPTHLVYPGAMHTRFEHSLGVYGCMIWMVERLIQRPNIGASLTQKDILCVLAAALLHDIGHYPFAHSLEALHIKGRDTPKHEDVGRQIVMGEIERWCGPQPLAEILRVQWGVDPERVMSLCVGTAVTPKDRLLQSMISGAIDADKMDYLERDSHHMGVPYGRHYDRQRLISSLTTNAAQDKLAIEDKGKVSAEMFIFSRYTMFSEAYWHHTVRAASSMVENALGAFYSRGQTQPSDMLNILLGVSDDQFLDWLYDEAHPSSATRYLLDGMVNHKRALFKRVLTLSRVYTEPHKCQAYDIVYAMSAEEIYALVDRLRVTLGKAINMPLHPASLIIDTPPRDKDRLETIDVVYPHTSGIQTYPLHELSRIVAGVQKDFMTVVKKIRIFAEPTLARALSEHPGIQDVLLDEILASG